MKPEAYRQFAELEEEHWWFRARRRVYLDLLRHALGSYAPERILDVGAGVGGFLAGLSELSSTVHHTELSPECLATCRERGYSRGVRAEARALPYAAMSFDLVCLFDVIEHVDEDTAVMHEVARVLRPEGLALITVPAYPWLFGENDRVSGHRRRYTRSSLKGLIENAHLGLVRCTYTNTLMLPAIAAYVLAAKGARALRLTGSRQDRTNLSVKLPRLLNECCYRSFVAELNLSRRWDLPFGHSILALARKRELLLTPVASRRLLARATAAVGSSLAGS